MICPVYEKSFITSGPGANLIGLYSKGGSLPCLQILDKGGSD